MGFSECLLPPHFVYPCHPPPQSPDPSHLRANGISSAITPMTEEAAAVGCANSASRSEACSSRLAAIAASSSDAAPSSTGCCATSASRLALTLAGPTGGVGLPPPLPPLPPSCTGMSAKEERLQTMCVCGGGAVKG